MIIIKLHSNVLLPSVGMHTCDTLTDCFSSQVLLKNKELRERINQRDKNSDAALHVASHSGHINIVKVKYQLSSYSLHINFVYVSSS